MGGGVYLKPKIFKQNWIISIKSRFIQLLVIWLDPTHWHTDPPNHPHTHPWVGVSQQIINLQTELIYSIFSHLTWPNPLTHWPTQPPTHPPMGGGVSTNYKIFKQNWITSIRPRFIQLLVIWLDPTHWSTDPPNHPHTHPWVGVSLQIINLQTELNYLD